MDDKDRELLNLLQEGFPVNSRPFYVIGQLLGIEENAVIERIQQLKSAGYIRRLSGVFNPRKLGYKSTLCAMKVPEDRIEEVCEIINHYNTVTHNYIRQHAYNVWFTIIAECPEKVDEVFKEIKDKANISEIMNLPAVKLFKIRTNFNMMEAKNG